MATKTYTYDSQDTSNDIATGTGSAVSNGIVLVEIEDGTTRQDAILGLYRIIQHLHELRADTVT